MAKNDVAIKDLLAKVESQTTALGAKPKVSWVTNGVFKYNKDEYFNINVVQDLGAIALAFGFLLRHEDSFQDACAMLDIEAEFRWDGYLVSEWMSDFKTRIAMIKYARKKAQLDATKTKLQGLVSEEARTEMELEEIAKSLSE